MFLSLIVFSIAFVLICIYLYSLVEKKPKNFPPGPPNIPFFGGYLWLLMANYTHTFKAANTLSKLYKSDVIGVYIGTLKCVFVNNYKLGKEALTKEEFNGRADVYVTRNRSFGELNGIFFIDGPFWKEQRRFSLRHLRDYGFGRRFLPIENMYEEGIKSLIDDINSTPSSLDSDIQTKKGRIMFPDFLYGFLSNAILHMLVGERFDKAELRNISRGTAKFFLNNDATGRLISLAPWLKYIAPDYFGYTSLIEENARIRDFVLKLVKKRKINFSDDYKADFMDTYFNKIDELQRQLGHSGTFTENQLLWTLVDYFFPSPNVIAPTLQMLWSYLCRRPDVQLKVQEEIDRVVGRSRLPNLDDRKSMPYTEAVLRESIRIDPVLPINTPRRCTEDTTFGGYSIPQDAIIFVNTHSANNDCKVWENPSEFHPERHLDTAGNLIRKEFVLTFGAGKRLCAGETFARNMMFLLLASLLQNFSFKSVDKLPPNNDGNKLWGFVISLPSLWVDCISR